MLSSVFEEPRVVRFQLPYNITTMTKSFMPLETRGGLIRKHLRIHVCQLMRTFREREIFQVSTRNFKLKRSSIFSSGMISTHSA